MVILSTYMRSLICFVVTVFMSSRWCSMEFLRKNGLGITKEGSTANRNFSVLPSVAFLLIHFSYKNLVTSRSTCCIPSCGNTFSMPEMVPLLFVLNLGSKPHRSTKIIGSLYMAHSYILADVIHGSKLRSTSGNNVRWYIVLHVAIFLLKLFDYSNS